MSKKKTQSTVTALERRTSLGTFIRVAKSPYKEDTYFIEVEAPDKKFFSVSKKRDRVLMAITEETALAMVKSLLNIINHEPK